MWYVRYDEKRAWRGGDKMSSSVSTQEKKGGNVVVEVRD